MQLEVKLPPELRAVVRQVQSVGDAQLFLSRAYYHQDYSDLAGKYFAGIWNVATQSFDLDGVEQADYSAERGVLTVQATKLGPVALCALRQASVPFKGWALIPERGRGEGYDIGAVLDEYVAYLDSGVGMSQTG